MVYDNNEQVPFEDVMNRFGRMHTLSIWNVEMLFYYLVDIFQTVEKLHWLNAYLNQPHRTKVADYLMIIDF